MLAAKLQNKKKSKKHVALRGLIVACILLEVVLFHWYIMFGNIEMTQREHHLSMMISSSLQDGTAQAALSAFILNGNDEIHKYVENGDLTALLQHTSKENPYKTTFGHLQRHDLVSERKAEDDSLSLLNKNSSNKSISDDVATTLFVLQDIMGIDSNVDNSNVTENLLSLLPPWSQVLDAIGPNSIILGLERCQAYQAHVPIEQRLAGPAGMFSTGTNLLSSLMKQNCFSEVKEASSNDNINKYKHKSMSLWQVPWGKHNPAKSRKHHVASQGQMKYINQSAVLPIVTVRHPLTWLLALCQHSYSLKWTHDVQACQEKTLGLQHSVLASFGAASSGIVPRDLSYKSLAHVWKEWNNEYYENADYPLLMVRLEDLIFRPQEVVTQICDCLGGHMSAAGFEYQHESANQGSGHGSERTTDLVSAFVKYGRHRWCLATRGNRVIGKLSKACSVENNNNKLCCKTLGIQSKHEVTRYRLQF